MQIVRKHILDIDMFPLSHNNSLHSNKLWKGRYQPFYPITENGGLSNMVKNLEMVAKGLTSSQIKQVNIVLHLWSSW